MGHLARSGLLTPRGGDAESLLSPIDWFLTFVVPGVCRRMSGLDNRQNLKWMLFRNDVARVGELSEAGNCPGGLAAPEHNGGRSRESRRQTTMPAAGGPPAIAPRGEDP